MIRFAFVLLLLLVGSEARAEGNRVLLLSSPNPGTRVAAQRLSAELVASGFVVQSKRFVGNSISGLMESVGLGSGAVSAITILGRADALVADVWIADSTNAKTVGRRVEASEPEQLSVRAVEALRAGLLEISMQSEAPPAAEVEPAPSPPSLVPSERPPPPPRRWRASTGASFFVSSDAVGGSAGPMFRLAGLLGGSWWLGGSLLAPIWGAEAVDVPVGQALARAELIYKHHLAPTVVLTPTVALGGYWIGHGKVEEVPADHSLVGVVSVGLGAGVYVNDSAYLLWDIQAVFFAPKPTVIIRNFDRAGPGIPGFVSTVGLNVEF